MYEDLNTVLEYIENHLHEDISLDDLANHVNYSKSHLSREFNKYIRISLPDYITKRRLSNAALMVYNTGKSISYIADTNGFNSVKYFSTLFKKELGISPTEYRKRSGFIYLFPRRILKGGKTTIMKKLEDVVFEINVEENAEGEVKITMNDIEFPKDVNEVEATIKHNIDGETEVIVESK
jgi:AraC-like DNA-binding protein